MRSPGYLEALVRTARPSPVAAAVHAVRRLDWGPTRLPVPVDETDAVEAPVSSRPPVRRTGDEPSAALPSETRAPARTDAAAPPATEPPAPRHPASPLPVVVTRVEERAPEHPPAARATHDVQTPVDPPSAATLPPPAIPPTVRAADGARDRDRAPTPTPPRLPVGTEAAFERLERLARRFAAAVPPETARPAPPDPPPPRTTAREDGPAPTPERPAIVVSPVPRTPAREAPPRRVEIGSIEVFVTQPPAPAPVAASVARSRAVAPPARPERLSRPLHPYGFGQG